MKLLIITQKVDKNDSVLGFFGAWIREFSKYSDQVMAVGLSVGDYDLPDKIKVFSLGKEKGNGKISQFLSLVKILLSHHEDYDQVFVHMNPIYLALFGWWWKLTGKKTALWYTHRQVDFKLRLAEKFADVIFTASPESFRLDSRKVKVVGHGIDVADYFCQEKIFDSQKTNIIHIGRLTKIKNCDTLILAGARLRDKGYDFKLIFVGGAVTEEDKNYELFLRDLIKEKDLVSQVDFIGAVPAGKVKDYLCDSDISVNLTPTGGVDKVVLESMAGGRIVLSSNLAFREYFGSYASQLIFKERDDADLAEKLAHIISSGNKKEIEDYLKKVIEDSSIEKLAGKVFSLWK